MIRRTFALVAVLALAGLATAQPAQPRVVQKVDHPRLRAALHELREARKWLAESKDAFPPEYKERALASTEAAIEDVRTILAVKDVNTFVGVDRNDDYYKKYTDHPRLRAALEDLRDARDEVKGDKDQVGAKREEIIDHIDMAIGDVLTLIRYKPKR
jgi:hypothetical protein